MIASKSRCHKAVSRPARCRARGNSWIGQIALHGRTDPPGDLIRRRRRQRFHLHDVAEHREPDQRAGSKARPQLWPVNLERLRQAPKHLATDELSHERGRGFVAHNRSDHSEERSAGRRIPRVEKESREPLAEPVEPWSQEARDELGWIDREVHRRPKDALFRSEVVKDKCRIDPGRAGYPAHCPAFVANLAEMSARCGKDLLPCPPRPRSPSCSWHRQ